jgi:nucleoside-diphosphate kinase
MDRTLILVKPDAYERGLTGEIIARFERKGFRICALRRMVLSRDWAERHYEEHKGKEFFEPLVDFITGGPLVAMILEGERAIEAARQMIGSTDPVEATPGSIRGDLGLSTRLNLVHGSDSPESAAREIRIFFPEV